VVVVLVLLGALPIAAQEPPRFFLAAGKEVGRPVEGVRLPASNAYLIPSDAPAPADTRLTPLTYRALSRLGGPWRGIVEPALARSAVVPTLTLTLDELYRLVGGTTDRASPVVISITHRGGAAAYAASVTPMPAGEGYFYYLSFPYTFTTRYDDVVVASQDDRLVSVSVLTVTALADPVSNVVSGVAPPREKLEAYYLPGNRSYRQTATVEVSGTYAIDFSSQAALDRGEAGYVARIDAGGGRQVRHFVLPQFRLDANGCTVDGRAAPRSSVDMTVTHTTGRSDRLWAFSDREGWFRSDYGDGSYPRTYPCESPDLTSGDRVTATAAGQQMALTFPTLTAHPDVSARQIHGKAPPSSSLLVVLAHAGQAYQHVVTATVQGDYLADFSGDTDWDADEGGTITYFTPDGHRVTRRYWAPFLNATFGTFDFEGRASNSGVPLTLTVRGQSGVPKDVLSLRSDPDDAQFRSSSLYYSNKTDTINPNLRLEEGDELILDDGVLTTALTLPFLEAHADYRDNTVQGRAPAGHPLQVTVGPGFFWGFFPPKSLGGQGGYLPPYVLWPPAGSPTRIVTPTADGTFVVDFSSLKNSWPGDLGMLVYTDTNGHLIRYPFIAPIVQVQVGGHEIRGVAPTNNLALKVALLDANGETKYHAEMKMGGYSAAYQIYLSSAIEPGDIVVIRQGTETTRIYIPDLTAHADRQTTSVSGTAPPGVTLRIFWVSRGTKYVSGARTARSGNGSPSGEVPPPSYGSSYTQTVTVAADGTYSATFAGQTSFQGGDYGYVVYDDQNGNQVFRRTLVQSFDLSLGQSVLYGYSDPALPITMTLEKTRSTISRTATTNEYGYFSLDFTPHTIDPGDRLTLYSPGEVLSMTVPVLTARPNWVTGIVSGEAPPNARLLFSWGGHSSVVTATAGGTYAVDMTSLVSGEHTKGKLPITMTYVDDQGNAVYISFAFPSLKITLGDSLLSGFFPAPGHHITATVYGPTGTLKARSSSTSSAYNSSFSLYLFDPQGEERVPLEAGDRITITDGADVVTFTVPLLTASVDLPERQLNGIGPPHTWLRVVLGGRYPSAETTTRQVYTGDTGRFALDFHGTSGWRGGEPGEVRYSDVLGNSIGRGFEVPYYRRYFPLVAHE
jgi:hypothetical protein